MDNLFSTLTGYAGCQYDAPHAEGLKCPAILLSCDKRIVQEENSPPPGRFLVENMMTKTQPDSVSTQEQNQATSSLSLAYLAWDILYLSSEGHRCPLTLLFPGTAPAVLLIPRKWEAEVQQWWHQAGSGHSGTCAWPVCQCSPRDAANPASCCPSKSLLVAAWLHATERHYSVKVQTEFVAKKNNSWSLPVLN